MQQKKIIRNSKKRVVRKITVTPKQTFTTFNLGGGFQRHDYYQNVGPNEEVTITYRGGTRNPISAGWFNSGLSTMTTLSYPSGVNNWILKLRNPLNVSTQLGFFFISKL